MKSLPALLVVSAGLLGVLPVRGAVFTSELVASLPPVGGAAFHSDPSTGVVVGGFFYFAASDGPGGTTGRELWRTDGTSAGTTLVKDIRPGAADSSPAHLTAAGTNLFFVADDGVQGFQLWKSDGTTAGTARVTDIAAAGQSGFLWTLRGAGNSVYFQARIATPVSTNGFFKSDGTAAGTVQLAGPGGLLSSGPTFGAFDTSGNEAVVAIFENGANALWRTDGTVAGSVRLESVTNFISSVGVLPPNCYYVTRRTVNNSTTETLLRRPLTAGGGSEFVSSAVGTLAFISLLAVVNARLHYNTYVLENCQFPPCGDFNSLHSVANGGTDQELFSTGGTLSYHGVSGGQFYFTSSGSPQVLRRTDGTTGGTVAALDFQPLGLTPGAALPVGARVFFGGSTAAMGFEPGVTDLTPAGTRLLADLRAGTNGSSPAFLGALGTNAFFAADDGLVGRELWRADGTSNGTVLLKDIAAGADSPPPTEIATVGNALFLSVETPDMGRELWKSDGTAAGTSLVADIRPGASGSNPTNLTAWNGALYFAANDGTNGVELWRSDGTAAGTFMVKNVRAGPSSSNPSQLIAAGGLLFFVADDGAHGAELWRSDGTDTGTSLAQDIVPGIDPGQVSSLSAAGDTVYFLADAGSSGREPWFSNGQPGGTQFLKNLAPGTNHSTLSKIVLFGGALYFVGGGGSALGLWRTDGTPEGTTFIKSGSFSELRAAGTNLWLTLSRQLWRSDGTSNGTALLKDFAFISSQLPVQLTSLGSKIFFTVGEDVWCSDGTTNGTVLAADLPVPPGAIGNPANHLQRLTPFQGALLFTALTPTFGRELWSMTPGQAATLVEDLEPGMANAGIRHFAAAPDRVFYVARTGGHPAWQVRALTLQSLGPPSRAPFAGTPPVVPARLEAEDFDRGGEGVAYHDTTLVNEGGQYRKTEAVDLETCDDTGGGFCVSFTQPGEFLEYTFNAASNGLYRLNVRASSVGAGATFEVAKDGVTIGGARTIPDSGGGWTTIAITGIPMSTGVHVLRLTFNTTNTTGNAGRVNWLEWVFTTPNVPPSISLRTPTHGAFFRPGDSVLLSGLISDTTSEGPVHAEFLIDGQSVGAVPASPYQFNWRATPGAHVMHIRATDSYGLSTNSIGRLFFVTDPVVPLRAGWRYNDSGVNQGTAWRQLNFNEAGWSTGNAELGFGDGDETTLLNSATSIVTHYFRRRLTNDLAGVNYASLQLWRDDGAVVFLNGQEIARVNLPAPPATIAFNTRAVTNVGVLGPFGLEFDEALDILPVPASAFVSGTNLLAVEVHQSTVVTPASRFDLSFDLELFTATYNAGAVLTLEALNGRALVRWPDHLIDWTLEHSTNLVTWTTVGTTPQRVGGFFLVNLPTQARDFFRLRHAPAP